MINNTNIPSSRLRNVPSTAPKPNYSSLTRSSFRLEIPAELQALVSAVKQSPTTDRSLGDSFQPGEYDVVCGRGRGCYCRPGNKRFRQIVSQHIPKYQSARNKLGKSMVLNDILEQVREQNNGNTRFVKKDKKQGTWIVISDHQAREKVGHAMREAVAAIKNKEAERR